MTTHSGKSALLSLRIVGDTLAISLPTAIEAIFGQASKSTCDARLASWARNVIRHARIDLDVRGLEHIVPGTVYVVMSNHQSLYDIPVLYAVLGSNLRMVTKKELFAIPIFGAAMRAAGFIELDRKDRKMAIQALDRAKNSLQSGTFLWMAPEGTRSPDGSLLAFKKGGFHLAMQLKLPILPVALSGTRNVLPAGGVRSRGGETVRVTIAPPIDPGPYEAEGTKSGRARLMDDVRIALENGL